MYNSPVPVPEAGWEIHYEGHQWSVKTILYSMTMFMRLQVLHRITTCEDEDAGTKTAPAFPERKIDAITEALRFVTRQHGT